MTNDTPPLWTLAELADQVTTALSHDYAGSPNQRVSDVPTTRVIRYYTTLGLIDRALAMRGRTALYGRRHLLQLVAIKRLQAGGHSIAEVQTRLAGLPDADLAEIARLDVGTAPQGKPRARAKRAFWKEQAPEAPPRPPDRSRPTVSTVQQVQLAPGITLHLERHAGLTDAEAAAIAEAAIPLLALLNPSAPTPQTIEGSPR